jgi:hypothetical protein
MAARTGPAFEQGQSNMAGAHPQQHCLGCVHFRNDAAFLESAFSGLTSLSSGFGSVRGDDGICRRHDRYLSARSFCSEFSPADASRSDASA